MKITILGSGNVATHIAFALQKAGHQIIQVFSRSISNANALAAKLNASGTDNLSELKQADMYLIAVADDALRFIASQINSYGGLVLHTSGSTGMDVLAVTGIRYGVMYPVQTFSKQKQVEFVNVPLAIEGSSVETLDEIRMLAGQLSTKIIELSSAQRLALHVSAVFACNFTNHLYAIAKQILDKEKIDFDLIRPLITETAGKVNHHAPIEVQTGPAVRGDEHTISKHLNYLLTQPENREIYQLLSNGIAKLSNSDKEKKSL